MFKEYDLYYLHSDDIYLDQEKAREILLMKASPISILSLVNSYKNTLRFKDGVPVIENKEAVCNDLMRLSTGRSDMCYIIRNNNLIILDAKIYYGIMSNNNIVSLYDNKEIRDAKLQLAKEQGMSVLFEDISSSTQTITDYKKQKRRELVLNQLSKF